jgi:predicted metal-dependent HD superfamily phosphohydrolase
VLSDADLAILASPPERYADYAAAVREEYAEVPDADFAAGRAAILEALRDQGIYRTEHARTHWEPAARANLDREISALRRR